jgi:hypothetical protein
MCTAGERHLNLAATWVVVSEPHLHGFQLLSCDFRNGGLRCGHGLGMYFPLYYSKFEPS